MAIRQGSSALLQLQTGAAISSRPYGCEVWSLHDYEQDSAIPAARAEYNDGLLMSSLPEQSAGSQARNPHDLWGLQLALSNRIGLTEKKISELE